MRATLRALADPVPGVFALLDAAERLAVLVPKLALLDVSPFGTLPESPADERGEQARAASRSRRRRLLPTPPPARSRGAPKPAPLPVGEKIVTPASRGPTFSFRTEPRPRDRPEQARQGPPEPPRVEETILELPPVAGPEPVPEPARTAMGAAAEEPSAATEEPSAAAEEVASTTLAEGSRPLVGGGLLADLVEAVVAERGGERGSSSGRGRGAPQPGERGAPARRAPEPSNGAASPDGTPPSPGEPPARPGRLAAPPSGGLGSPAWTPAEAGARANREWAWPGAPSVATGEEPRGAPAVDAAPSSEPTSRGVEPGGGARREEVEPGEVAALVNEALIEQARRHGVDLL